MKGKSRAGTWMEYAKKGLIGGGIFCIFPVLCFYLLEFYTHNPFEEVRHQAQIFNILLFAFVQGILFCMSGSLKLAVRTEVLLTMIYGISNAYVVKFRTNPLVPWDFLSWRTAASVAGNYNFMPTGRMLGVTLCFLLLFVLSHWVRVKCNKLFLWKRLMIGTILMVALCIFGNTLQNERFQNQHRLYNKVFTPVYMTNVDGLAVTFVMNLAYVSIEKPSNYSMAEAQETLNAYEQETDVQKELPNIIVIMDEAFSDLSVLGEFTTNQDYMPFLHRLQAGAENTMTGMLNVSVCGGNTANTEFEFLTGNTMAFLPQGSVPYQQYIKGEIPSIVSYLRSLGYATYAAHPYYASGWDRDTVYPNLGFSNTLFLDSYVQKKYIRNYVSDETCFQQIQSIFEEKEKGKPCFVFNVTMQNHGGYSEESENFQPEIQVDGSDNFSLRQYLSLIRESDLALENLISYFSEVEENTMIVFFGDHQPSDAVVYPICEKNGKSDIRYRYEVPYVIWTNYETETVTGADTSANYLGIQMLERAGITLPAYQSYLKELQKEYPILSAARVVDEQGRETSWKEEKKELLLYQKMQYYQLFDWRTNEKEKTDVEK